MPFGPFISLLIFHLLLRGGCYGLRLLFETACFCPVGFCSTEVKPPFSGADSLRVAMPSWWMNPFIR